MILGQLITDNFLHVLIKLDLHQLPDVSDHFGRPDMIMLSPKALEDFTKALGKKKK